MTGIDTPGTSHLRVCGAGRSPASAGTDIDLENRTLRIGETRVDVGGRAFDQDEPKTANAGRVLPIPDALLAELSAAKARQAAEKLALGEAYADLGYVVCNEAGEPYHPSTLSHVVAGGYQRPRRARSAPARCAPYLRDAYASSRRTHRIGGSLAGPR